VQVKRTARGVIINYIGGRKGLTSVSDEDHHHAQYLSMISRGGLRITLGNAQLARRLKVLIGGCSLQWRGRLGNTYEFRTESAMEAFRFAHNWLEERGVPTCWDEINKCLLTTRLGDYEHLAALLEHEL